MRLLNATTHRLEAMPPDKTVRYAILSHTWGKGEVTFQEIDDSKAKDKQGYTKIRLCCEQALKDGLDFVWVDTCCIDKSSSAEFSETINSMFVWYRDAEVCYVFLDDVDYNTSIPPSATILREPVARWFTRGWTLQELLAPSTVKFYAKDWSYIGDKRDLLDVLSTVTSIDREFFFDTPLSAASVAERMSWVSRRNTTRAEDIAYCLLGIFDVNMPLLYGEGGQNAFIRLQQEIMKTSDDQSIFAWGGLEYRHHSWESLGDFLVGRLAAWMFLSDPYTAQRVRRAPAGHVGLLAKSPKAFADTAIVEPASGSASQRLTTRGPYIDMRLLVNGYYALLSCRLKGKANYTPAIQLECLDGVWYRPRDLSIVALPTLYMNIAWIAQSYQVRTFSIASSPTYEWPYPWHIRSLPPGMHVEDVVPNRCWSKSRRTVSTTYDNHSSDEGANFKSDNGMMILRKVQLASKDGKREFTLVLLVSAPHEEHHERMLRFDYGIEKGRIVGLTKSGNAHNFQTSVPPRTITLDGSITIAVLAQPRNIGRNRMLVIDIMEGRLSSPRSFLFWKYYLCETEHLGRGCYYLLYLLFYSGPVLFASVRRVQSDMAKTGSYFGYHALQCKTALQKIVRGVIAAWKVLRMDDEDEDRQRFLLLVGLLLRFWWILLLFKWISSLVIFLSVGNGPDIVRMDSYLL
jgi:Heterokaryon incompatibility protein (HET)